MEWFQRLGKGVLRMLLGEVIGTVVSTQKYEGLSGAKFLIVEEIQPDGTPIGKYVVAVDEAGAGEGDMVLFVTGSSARATSGTAQKPVDALIMGIVDSWEVWGSRKYEKWSSPDRKKRFTEAV